MTTPILLKNYWCPQCRVWVAASDIVCGKHIDCRTAVEWREFVPAVFRQDKDEEEQG